MNVKSILAAALVITLIASSCKRNDAVGLMLEQPGAKHKTVAVLGFIANVNYNLMAVSEAGLRDNTRKIDAALKTNTTLQSYIGADWSVVWGPVISNSPRKSTTTTVDSFVTDNTMYVAKGKDAVTGNDLYVVAIAGTNIVSEKGWLQEDFNVFTKDAWGQPNSGHISKGTGVGMGILSAMKDPVTNKTMMEYFDGLSKARPFEVAFTGHSLGGALSPAMALKFIEWKEQNRYDSITVSEYPIAGPTPGDDQFAAYATAKFGSNYFSVINLNDIVPHSWELDMYNQIPNLYNNTNFNAGAGFAFPASLTTTFNSVRVGISLQRYKRIGKSAEFTFMGRANTYVAPETGSFLKEAGYQHTKAYFYDAFAFPQPVVDVISSIIEN